MAKLKIRGNDLKQAGVESGPLAGLAVAIAKKSFRGNEYERFLSELKLVTQNPDDFVQNQIWATYANKLVEHNIIEEAQKEIELNEEAAPYRIWGSQNVENGAKNQMDIAAHLPITHSGALMADAHQGYGLPIGGVLAVENAVIPYGVGMDIGCRMCMSVFPIKASRFKEDSYMLKHIIKDNSRFGKNVFDNPDGNHEILDNKLFKEISTVRRLKDKAYKQLGSSGSGNHFVEFGVTEIKE
ncbi:MAG: RtcB family protein, partial [Saprospiraceae bacterium]